MARIAGVTPTETRLRLLAAAADVFEREGYDGATVSAIAAEAGLTTGAIYTHYSGKAELLVDALRSHGHRATSGLVPEERPDARAMIVAMGEQLLDTGGRSTALLAESALLARRDPDVAALLAELITERETRMTVLVNRARNGADPRAAAAARFSLMLGLGSTMLADLDLPPVDEAEWSTLVADVVDALIR